MDRWKRYKDPNFVNFGRTRRQTSYESRKPSSHDRRRGEIGPSPSDMAFGPSPGDMPFGSFPGDMAFGPFPGDMMFGSYGMPGGYYGWDPYWNMGNGNRDRHWANAYWPWQYMASYHLPKHRSQDAHTNISKHGPARTDPDHPPSRKQKGKSPLCILLTTLVISMVAVVVVTPLMIVYVFEKAAPITEGTINLRLKLADQFQTGMGDPTSNVFQSTESEICPEVKRAFTTDISNRNTNYACKLKSLRQGSITVNIELSITGRFTIPDNDQYVQTLETYIGTAGTLGSFTVISGSIFVTSASYTQQGVQTIVPVSSIPPEIQIDSSITFPHGELSVGCNVKYAPITWNEIRLISPEVSAGIVAVGYVNGTTQKDNNSYQLTLHSGESNVSLSLLFPNTTKHCFGRRNYSCAIYENAILFSQTTKTVSIPVVDVADNVNVVFNTMVNEGDTYYVNCTGDLAPPSSTLDLYTRNPNDTPFTKSSVTPIVTVDGLTESCYLQTTKSYNFIADRANNGTELQCAALNTSSGAASMSEVQFITVQIAEMEMNDSITTPEEDLTISCNVRYAPSGWDNFSIVSVDNADIYVTAFSNGTIQQGNSSYTARLQQGVPGMTLSVVFPNTTTHCYARGRYVCTLTDNDNIVINNTASVTITDRASNLTLEGKSTVNEGDRYELNCSGRVATEGGDFHLHARSVNTTDFVRMAGVPIVTVGNNNDLCYQSFTKTYSFIAEKAQNGTEFACVATNDKLSSYERTGSTEMIVEFADFNSRFHLPNSTWIPALGDKNSDEYKRFAEQIESDTDYVYERSNIKDNYQRSKVTGLEPGSVNVIIVLYIDIQVTITDSSNNVITTKLTAADIVKAFVDTLPLVADDLTNTDLKYVETDSIVGNVVTRPGEDYECSNTKVDVVFLLDASGSIGLLNFRLMKFFIQNVTANILLGPDAVQISVVKFSSNPIYEFWLNEHYGVLTLNPAIESIVYTGGGTRIERALQYVRDNALLVANGARPDAEKVIILMTDGQSGDDLAPIASTLKSEGVLVSCVGIGSGIDMAQLNDIAYNSSYIFFATDFNVLTQIGDTVRQSTCDNNDNNS